MTDNRKEQERAELYSTIWKVATDLRGSVDGWDFKQYVLGILFYRYISENITNYINAGEREAGDATFDYAKLLHCIGDMKLGDYKDSTIDAFGDAYE
ncbi:MAG: type I restriction-modification system subunit M N-terminal domain-containing protein, partial [Coriobacteriales bacterium]|nr:type I restriction-modification system subunit M N-terminal domain-containing protein [Coriobacteriales bacterium]